MKPFALALALLAALACSSTAGAAPSLATPETDGGTAVSSTTGPPGSVELSQATCPQAAAHVYHPYRLRLLAGCREVTVRGIIQSAKAEPDGDFHVRLLVDATERDPQGGHYINAENTRQQHGFLVLEPVCENLVTQKDAIAACQGYHNDLRVPGAYSHVAVTGYWVLDTQHGWQELHPLTRVDRV